MRDFAPFLPLIGAVLALVCLICAFRDGRRRRLIDNLPTSKTTGVFIGFVELKGTAESASPLASYLAEQACVHYSWTVQEHWSRTVTETYTDDKGNTQTRTRTESGWTQVADGGETIPFYLQDDCGVILIQPEGAKIEPLTIFDETCTPLNALYYGKGPAGAVSDSSFRRRFVEVAVPVKANLYLVGQARERQDIVAPEIAADSTAPMFLISTRTEEQVSGGMKWGSRGWTFFGLLAAVGFMVWSDMARNIDPQRQVVLYVAIGCAYLFTGLLLWIWMVYNALVDVRQRVRAAWSLVDIQLKRRFDLIPNLVNCVKGYQGHEAQVQTELAALRSQLSATPPGVAGPDHAAVSTQVIAIAERYPELKANDAFLALQKSLSDTEQRIALARSYFNEIATHYNTRLEIVPERYVALLGAMKPQSLMAANEFERAPVTVDLTPSN
ncbi:MAG TPA: LemA family protein [Candidatus Acidoferrales bacterium]|nr:LemA family protein [Candidatus Acidoferrales bacterium]